MQVQPHLLSFYFILSIHGSLAEKLLRRQLSAYQSREPSAEPLADRFNMFTTPIGNQELLRNTKIFDSCVAEMVSSLPSTTMKTVPRRRNGRPQACEPCHKRKVACDHRLPVCSRCKRGGITEQCVYITKRTNNVLPTPPKSSELYSPTSDSPNSLIRPPYSDDGSRAHEGGFGYLGATSFSAVLQEAENSLSSMQGIPGHVDFPDSEVREKCGRLLDQKPSSFAVDILRSIPDHDTSIALFDSLHTPFDAWARLAGRKLLDSLWATFGDILDGPRSEKALWGMATTLCLNTADILKDDHVDPDRWFSEFSGPRFRWESIGILFAYWATALFSDRHRFARAGLYLTDETKITALKRYKNNAWNCSQLCWEACQGNSLMLFLLYQHSIIESNLSGDAEMKHWRLHGDVVAMTTYLGLHTSSKPENDASISTQIQRRLFASVFKVDKLLATFAGRPPLLSHRFCSTPLPLDLSDEELLQPSREAAASLNAQGWNTAGNIHHTTILRARTMIAYTRDAILEIALRSNFDGCEKKLTYV
ncbi:hypothetical protein VHEMI03690 [[Torrubiella] hemipterigena]|uniref:Zn(2)-C6 fungal-type domain-containing protein n=1 Tax=[Torrubiella] hemipterigena TaxID=1531966 RepID=A0A0A1STB6_9HYPO|nr:hypothetical protein VHEMI03690 [[Torrubiella] hemipterigena]